MARQCGHRHVGHRPLVTMTRRVPSQVPSAAKYTPLARSLTSTVASFWRVRERTVWPDMLVGEDCRAMGIPTELIRNTSWTGDGHISMPHCANASMPSALEFRLQPHASVTWSLTVSRVVVVAVVSRMLQLVPGWSLWG